MIGLTSPDNVAFVEGLECYDKAVPYIDLESLADVPIVFVDHSGDGEIVSRLHRHFGDNVKYSCMVGMTHVGAAPRDGDLPGAEPCLGPLADNGGPTQTHALLPGSPAINAGASNGLAGHHRGFPPVGIRDIGALEFQRAHTDAHACPPRRRCERGRA